jgi:multiple sugar transport system substrate-binding protein
MTMVLNRRNFVQGTAGLAAAGLLARSNSAFAAGVDWRRFAGTKLEANLIKSPRGELLQKYNKEFFDLTGIEVSSEQIPEQQQRQKAVIELSSGKPNFDVVHVSYHVQKRQFDKANWLADMSGFMKDPSLTEPGLVESDFTHVGLSYAKNPAGELRSFPWSVDYFIVYWNKELFAKKGLAFPNSFDELATTAEALTDPKAGIYGYVGRGLKNANVALYGHLILGWDIETTDAANKLLTDSPDGIAAAAYYQRLLTKSAPPGVSGFNWAECQSAFVQGRAAMWVDGVGFAPPLEDPEKSRVVGKVGYSVMPKGPKAQGSATYGDGIGIAAASKNKEAAYLYCQWAISKQMGARLLQSGGGVPFRNSILEDQDVRKGVTMPIEWLNAVQGSGKVGRPGLPVIVPVAEFRDIIGIALTNTLSGGDPATEMRKATDQFRPILEKSEKA